MTAELLAESQRCLRDAAQRLSGEGEAVRYLRCTFIPEQQRCLDLFEAGSASAVRRVNDIAQVPFGSIGQASESAAPGIGTSAEGVSNGP
jgi:hypothetical protein